MCILQIGSLIHFYKLNTATAASILIKKHNVTKPSNYSSCSLPVTALPPTKDNRWPNF